MVFEMKEIYVVSFSNKEESSVFSAFHSYDNIPHAIEQWLNYAEDYTPLTWDNEYHCHTDENEFFIDIIPLYNEEK